LAGGELWDAVQAVRGTGELSGSAALGPIVFACARYKCELVALDERDAGPRQALNLGHTVGHAIEAATGYRRYRHGEAVGLGVLAALRLSGADRLRDEVEAMLVAFAQPVRLDRSVALDAVMAALARDKKRTAEGVPFVLLPTPGEPRIGQVIDADRVEQAVTELYG
jgi:shikimate kinase/3-dehydroquinate synthase